MKKNYEIIEKKVEERINSNNIDVSQLSNAEIQKILHNLEVHKVELEMQNEQLHYTQKALEDNSRKYHELFEDAPVGYLILCNQYKVLEVNTTFATMIGCPKEEIISKSFSDYIPEDFQDMFHIAYRDVVNKNHLKNIDIKIKTTNGTKFWAKLNLYSLNEGDGDSCLLSVSNIDDIKNSQFELLEKNNELKKAKEKAEESDRLKGEFLRNISHEIRTPLNSIIGFSKLIDNPQITYEKRSRYANVIVKNSHFLLNIIEDVLESAKISTGQTEVVSEHVNLNEVLHEAYHRYKDKLFKKEVDMQVYTELSDRNSTIFSDRTKLNRIIDNLLSNAIKFTLKGHINIGYKLENDEIKIFVNDTGVGVEPKNKEHIFELFSQEKKDIKEKAGGLGLGLPITKAYTNMIGGKIWFDSEKGKGSCFYVHIPYKPVFTDDAKNKEQQKHYDVLIAEDEEFNYLFLEALFEDEFDKKFKLYHAINGKEAIEMIEKIPDINLVLMDIKMPIMDGYEATKKIKGLRPGISIIAQSAYSTESDRRKAFQAGCNDFIAKPIDFEELNQVINKYM